jgi:hypothetical protein
MRGFRYVAAGVFLVFLVGCGGGNKSTTNQTPDASATTESTVAAIDLNASSSGLDSGTGNTITFTATVKNAANNVLAGEAVVFSADSGSLQVLSATSDAAGEATARLSAGGNKSLRPIAVTAKVGSVTATRSVNVTGTTLTVTGTSSVQMGQSITLSFVAKDSSGTPVSGISASVTSTLGNALSANTAPLDYTGTGTVTYTATQSGVDSVRVTAAGVTQSFTINIASGADFSVQSPATNTLVPIGSPQVLTFQYIGTPLSGHTVSFSTDRGTLSGAATQTAGDGTAIVTITPSNAGVANVTATLTALNKSVTLPLLFSGTTPNSVSVQAAPTALAPNAAGSTLNQSTIEAVVRDSANNPVANTSVTFAITTGVGGSLSAASATTAADGKARVQYIAGTTSSAANGVTIRATAGIAQGNVNLTVNGSALFISIFRGVAMSAFNAQTYEVPFTLAVVDANGVAKANHDLELSVWPVEYGKGQLAWDATNSLWVVSARTSCVNEDSNRNGQLNSGEDTNANSILTPGLPISLPSNSVRTDSAGLVSFVVRYGKQYAHWIRGALSAKATVEGTESSSTYTDWLPILVDDIGDQAIPPAAANSPFGTAALCTDSN